MATETGNKLKVGTKVKERDHKLLDFITIEIVKVSQQKFSEQDIIILPVTPIINISFNKYTMSWELNNNRQLNT